MKKEMSREEFLRFLPLYGIGVFSLFGVLSCGSKEETQTETSPKPQMTQKQSDPCADLSGLTEADLNIRKTFEYVAETPFPEKLCDNCQFWVAPEAGSMCGGCQIIKGPIHPKGYCKQWVAKTT